MRGEDVKKAYGLLHSVVEKFLKQSAYSDVNISKLFLKLAVKPQVCKVWCEKNIYLYIYSVQVLY